MADVMNTTIRAGLGRRDSKRTRRDGQIPAELYGHKKENIHLSIPRTEVQSAVRHGAHLVELKGAVTESALIREVQWDPYGMEVVHLDLARVSMEELVEVSLSVELRGTAIGIKEGGVVQHVLYDAKILCPAGLIPDKLEAKISNLKVGEQFMARDLELPAGAKLITSPEQIVAQCVTPLAQADEQAVPVEPAEPELIGRKLKEDEEGEEE
jgi:large subunit ribosomal protein L25